MKALLPLLLVLPLQAAAVDMAAFKEKQTYLQQVQLHSYADASALRLIDQVMLLDCQTHATATTLKAIQQTSPYLRLSRTIAQQQGIVGIRQARKILGPDTLADYCNI